jgi:hypothetical protein
MDSEGEEDTVFSCVLTDELTRPQSITNSCVIEALGHVMGTKEQDLKEAGGRDSRAKDLIFSFQETRLNTSIIDLGHWRDMCS